MTKEEELWLQLYELIKDKNNHTTCSNLLDCLIDVISKLESDNWDY